MSLFNPKTWRGNHPDAHSNEMLQKLFGELAERYSTRPGGYTRVLKLGSRVGDNAPTSMIELVDAQLATKKAPVEEEAAEAKA